jgi:hypothetical protein
VGVLANHITADPDGRGYSSKSDAQVRDDLLAQEVQRYRDVPVGEIAGKAVLTGLVPKLKAATGNDNAQTLLDLIRGQTAMSVIEYTDTQSRGAVTAMLDDIVANTTVEQAEADALAALGTETVSKAVSLGYPNLTERDVHVARGGE